jgi:hypothetical protein
MSRYSSDKILRLAERYIVGGLPIPPSIVTEVQARFPCEACADRQPDPETSYFDDVAETAAELANAVNTGEVESREQLHDLAWETIDSSHRVTNTNDAIEALRYSSNDGYSIDNFGVEGIVANGTINWSRLAFGAFYADVMEHPDGPNWNEPFSCASCGENYQTLDEVQSCCPVTYECEECNEEWYTPEDAKDCCEDV